ncbi:MAG: hypothetical protein ACI4RH_11730, partial [Huintestinicola sp.]
VPSELREGITSSKNSMFNVTGNFKDNNGKVLLYCNPIIGRVIDGYAVTESAYFKGSEEFVTMHNGTKNYSIADIDKNADKIAFSAFECPTGKSGINSGTVYINDGQQLFLLGCISMSGAGSASSNGQYPASYSYGNGMMVRHAEYSQVGTENKTDFDLAVTDSFSQNNVPYIIFRYTGKNVSAYDGSNIDYPAKSITNDKFVFNIVLHGGKYDVPDGFRGIGSLNSTASDLTMFINGIKGNDSVIDLNMNFNMYRGDYEKYYSQNINNWNSYNVGLGLFNSLVQNKSNFTPSGYENDTEGKYTISDIVISGTVNHEVYKDEGGEQGYTNSSYFSCAGGLAGVSNSSCLLIDNAKMTGLSVNARYVTGGLIGSVVGSSGNSRVTIRNFGADGLNVGGGMFSGGLIAHVKNVEFEADGNTEGENNGSFKFGKISSKAGRNAFGDNMGVGGLLGSIFDNSGSIKTTVLIQNVDIEGESITSFGETTFVGSVIGCCGRDGDNVEFTKLININ